MIDYTVIQTVTGKDLDDYGQLFGIHRSKGSDAEFRKRILFYLTKPTPGTKEAIAGSFEDFKHNQIPLGVESRLIIRGRPPRFSIWEKLAMWFLRLAKYEII